MLTTYTQKLIDDLLENIKITEVWALVMLNYLKPVAL